MPLKYVECMRCWHCDQKLSTMRPPAGQKYHYAEVEIEQGRKVKVHVGCAEKARQSCKRLTAQPIRHERLILE